MIIGLALNAIQTIPQHGIAWHSVRRWSCYWNLSGKYGLDATLIDTDAFLFLTELTVLSFKNNSISGGITR
jgi:hypothetical protein